MKRPWRVIDTGPRTAAENLALDAALLKSVGSGASATLRFLEFRPSVVLIGYHQTVQQEIRRDFCLEKGIQVNRRLTGGGAIYFDSTQIGWELVAKQEEFGWLKMEDLSRLICEAAARGIRKLGVPAEFRPRNDIEVEGRKISGTGGVIDDGVCLYQGTLLVDFDIETMLRCLNVPVEKLSPKGLTSARERVTCLRELVHPLPSGDAIRAALVEGFSESLGVPMVWGRLDPSEETLSRGKLPIFTSDDWIDEIAEPTEWRDEVHTVHKVPGGLIRVTAAVDRPRRILKQTLITGDFFVTPRRAVFDLEAALKDTPFDAIRATLGKFFSERAVDALGLGAEDFADALMKAVEPPSDDPRPGAASKDGGAPTWRLIDGDPSSAAGHSAVDSVLLERSANGETGPALRFYRFARESVTVGRDQILASEARLEFTEPEGIEVGRRVTGGGALYHEPGQIGWSLIASRRELGGGDIESLLMRIGEGVSRGLMRLGIPAAFRPRSDIHVGGKAIGRIAAAGLDGSVLFQGVLHTGYDAVRMIKSLQIPVEKLTTNGIKAAEDRVTWLSRELGGPVDPMVLYDALSAGLAEIFAARRAWGAITPVEDALAEAKRPYLESMAWTRARKMPLEPGRLVGIHRCLGGTFRVSVDVDIEGGVIKDLFIGADAILHPPGVLDRLQSRLRGAAVSEVPARVVSFFAENDVERVALDDGAFIEAVQFPLRKLEAKTIGLNPTHANRIIASLGGTVMENLSRAKVMLLPYCAKPNWCDYRHLDACGECGGCTVGDAYRLAREHDMIPITITSFELLADTLQWCKANDYTFVGHCCAGFYEKRYEGFEKAGAPGVLFDIAGTTCYDLGVEEEQKAYHGEFRVELDLYKDDMVNAMTFVGGRAETPPAPLRGAKVRRCPTHALARFLHKDYKKPTALPHPGEDMTRMANETVEIEGTGSIHQEIRSEDFVLEGIAERLLAAERPTVIVGPLILWAWDEEAEAKAAQVLRLVEATGATVHVLPDYRPRLGAYDPSSEVDSPNPHVCIQHGNHDVAVCVGLHCYRTDFVLRLIQKHTPCETIALCGKYGHPSAHRSLNHVHAGKIAKLVDAVARKRRIIPLPDAPAARTSEEAAFRP